MLAVLPPDVIVVPTRIGRPMLSVTRYQPSVTSSSALPSLPVAVAVGVRDVLVRAATYACTLAASARATASIGSWPATMLMPASEAAA